MGVAMNWTANDLHELVEWNDEFNGEEGSIISKPIGDAVAQPIEINMGFLPLDHENA